jgi:hypothetical protein
MQGLADLIEILYGEEEELSAAGVFSDTAHHQSTKASHVCDKTKMIN